MFLLCGQPKFSHLCFGVEVAQKVFLCIPLVNFVSGRFEQKHSKMWVYGFVAISSRKTRACSPTPNKKTQKGFGFFRA